MYEVYMKEKGKKILSITSIVILLPYILTVFIKGEGAFFVHSTMVNDQVTVQVQGVEAEVIWEEYLLGILAREIPEEYSLEAIKAQAIIIQTRLAIESQGSEEYIYQDEYYTTADIQVKWGSNAVEMYNQLVTAIDETLGMTLQYEGELINPAYHSLNTGMTRNGNEVLGTEEYPYLVSVSCPMDLIAEEEITIFTISYEALRETLEEELELELEDAFTYEDIEIITYDAANYVLSIEVQGNIISGEQFRTMLGLKSSAFSFQEQEEELKITTEGSGHGLGLSQNTAHYMGLEDKKYQEILMYFYEGIEIVEK